MSVITISMKVGSEGSHIAEKIAQTLGYHFADKTTIGKVLSQYGLVEFDKEYDSAPGFWARFDAQREERRKLMVDMLNRVILALAHHGDMVILGRGGFAVLGGFADVLNVRIQAPLPIRIKRVMEQQNITEPERAEAFVTENESAHRFRRILVRRSVGYSQPLRFGDRHRQGTSGISDHLAGRSK